MSKKIMGNTKIELTNVRTGEKKVHEEHNMLTGHLAKILNINPWGVINPDSLMPLATRVMGGVALFPEQKAEDVNNDILFNDFTAYAQANANGTTDTRRGSINYTESGPIVSDGKDGYKFVWDFTTSQGNGTYNCVALTHPSIDKNYAAFAPCTNYGNADGFRHWGISSSTDVDAYKLLTFPQMYDEDTGIFYTIEWTGANNQFVIHKGRRPMDKILLGEAPLYGTAYAHYDNPAALIDGLTELIYDYENRTIILDHTPFNNQNYNSCSFRKEGGVPYAYIFSIPCNVSSSFVVIKINLETFSVEESTLTYSGANFRAYKVYNIPRPDTFPFVGNYIYLPKQDDDGGYARKAFYKVNITDVSDIKEIAIPEEIQNSDAKDVFADYGAGYIMKNDYGFWWIKRREYHSQYSLYTVAICNDEMVLMNASSLYHTYADYIHSSFGLKNTWAIHMNTFSSSGSTFLVPELFNYYMLTINNLSSPVTKTSEQLMKITYTLTEVDE